MAENRELQRRLYEGGYAGITWPKEYGGRGLSREYESAFWDEAADFVLPDFGALSITTFYVCVPTMLTSASPDFLRRFVPRVLAGQQLVCQFFSEPSSGSDLAGARTRLQTRDGDQWVLNGQKIWSTFAHLADAGMCLARTGLEPAQAPGPDLVSGPVRHAGPDDQAHQADQRGGQFCEEFFDDVVVPDADRLCKVERGLGAHADHVRVRERGAGRPQDDSPLEGPGPLTPDLVDLARRAGRLDDPLVRQQLARAHTTDYVGKVLSARVAQMGRLGLLNPGIASYVKLFRGTSSPSAPGWLQRLAVRPP